MNMRRIIRTQRLLAELGHADVLEALDELSRMRAPAAAPQAPAPEAGHAADALDARRYRWLRVNPVQCSNMADDQTYGRQKHQPEKFDAAIDAAMQAALDGQEQPAPHVCRWPACACDRMVCGPNIPGGQ